MMNLKISLQINIYFHAEVMRWSLIIILRNDLPVFTTMYAILVIIDY